MIIFSFIILTGVCIRFRDFSCLIHIGSLVLSSCRQWWRENIMEKDYENTVKSLLGKSISLIIYKHSMEGRRTEWWAAAPLHPFHFHFVFLTFILCCGIVVFLFIMLLHKLVKCPTTVGEASVWDLELSHQCFLDSSFLSFKGPGRRHDWAVADGGRSLQLFPFLVSFLLFISFSCVSKTQREKMKEENTLMSVITAASRDFIPFPLAMPQAS